MVGQLLEVLQQTLHPHTETRRGAEEVLQRALQEAGFTRQLLEVAAAEEGVECPAHLRQLSLVLITQQVRRRFQEMDAELQSKLLESSFSVMASSDSNLRNSGAVLLASIFLNGSIEEREHIISQLFSVFSGDDLGHIYLASRCLCEILEEANFQSQVDILVGCDSSLRGIVSHIDPSNVHIVRNIAKVYRLVAFRVCDARLANDFTADIDDVMMTIFACWMNLMIEWCDGDMSAADIVGNLGILIEVIQFFSVVTESFPAICSCSSHSKNTIGGIMLLAWRYLQLLVDIYANISGVEHDSHVAHDGDRIEVDVLVMHLFELLKICINISSQQTHAMNLGQTDINDLVAMLMLYMQHSEEQLEQYFLDGNEFVASDLDDSLELSLRHTGRDFVHEMFMSTPSRIFEAIVSKVEFELTSFYANLLEESCPPSLAQGVEVDRPVAISPDQLIRLEASLFALRCMGRKFTKRYLRSKRFSEDEDGEGSNSTSQNLETEVLRLQDIFSGLFNTFFNDNFVQFTTSSSFVDGDKHDQSILCMCRGTVSSLLSSFSQVLPVSSLEFLLAVLSKFASASMSSVECLASRLYHCSALGVILNLAVKNFDYTILVTDNLFERIVEALLDICNQSGDSTIHIPLENITHLVHTAALSLITSDEPKHRFHFLTTDIIEQLILLGLRTWSHYLGDPFSVEIAREMILALVSALKIDVDNSPAQGRMGCRERVTLFCQIYFPQLDIILENMHLGESNKNLGDLALRVLVESMSKDPLYGETSKKISDNGALITVSLLSEPTLQALSCVFSRARGKDSVSYEIDIGETLRSLSTFFSVKELEISTLDQDLCSDVVCHVLGSCQHILTTMEEFNYPVMCSSLSLVVMRFGDYIGDNAEIISILQKIIVVIFSANSNNNSDCILKMSVIHIFCRNPEVVSSALGSLSLGDGVNGLAFMIDAWFDLHTQLDSKYNRHISALGMMFVLEMYISQGVGEGFLHRILQYIVHTINAIENDSEEEDENNEAGLSTFSLCSDDEGEDSYDEQSDYFDNSDDGGGGDENPFAPAEMYLSDLIDVNGGSGKGHVYIPDTLVYCNSKRDPLYDVSLKSRLGDILSQNEDPAGFLMHSISTIDQDTQYLLRSLYQET